MSYNPGQDILCKVCKVAITRSEKTGVLFCPSCGLIPVVLITSVPAGGATIEKVEAIPFYDRETSAFLISDDVLCTCSLCESQS